MSDFPNVKIKMFSLCQCVCACQTIIIIIMVMNNYNYNFNYTCNSDQNYNIFLLSLKCIMIISWEEGGGGGKGGGGRQGTLRGHPKVRPRTWKNGAPQGGAPEGWRGGRSWGEGGLPLLLLGLIFSKNLIISRRVGISSGA